MASKNPEYYTYRPTKLKVSRLGVNISKEMNDTLNLESSQYMIVGEQYLNQGGSTSNTYALIVDDEGIAVNSSLVNRKANKNDYPVQFNGTLFVDGNIIVTGLISGSNSSNIIGGTSNYWKYAGNDSIYYDGKVTIGNYEDSRDTLYSLNISEPANKDMNKAQLSIQNRQLSQIRMGILGAASNSPVVWNTPEKTPIEFHVGRKTAAFDNIYCVSYSNQCAEWIVDEPRDTPYYPSIYEAPHLNIDENGNVGIRTSYNHGITYKQRRPNPQTPETMDYPNVYERMSLHVEGPLYASNILMYDYETAQPKSLDELYIRALGQTLYACNIMPGAFPRGHFQFRSNLSILAETEDDYALLVNGQMRVTSNVFIQKDLNVTGDYIGENLSLRNTASFSNDLYVQNNIYFKANMFKERLNPDTGSNEWTIINFDSNIYSAPGSSNLFSLGDGVATIGRLGAGIVTNRDSVNHQAVIRKRDTTIFELELMDRSSPKLNRAAYIGHPQVSTERQTDGSLVFLTPSSTDLNYNLHYNNAPQNIYFYAGYENTLSTFRIEQSNAPTLGVFGGKRVAINKYEPEEALDIHGNLQLDGSIYVKDPALLDPVKMGIWSARDYSFINNGSNLFKGMEYLNSAAAHVGINTIPQYEYGLVVDGKLKALQGLYTKEDRRISPWYSTYDYCRNAQLPAAETMFMIGKAGLGIRTPDTTMHIRDVNHEPTTLKLSQGSFFPSTMVHMDGLLNSYIMHLNDAKNIFEVFYGASNQIYTSTANRPLIMKANGTRHQVIINSNHTLLTNDSDALMVGGNLRVYGDINISGQYRLNGSAVIVTNSQVEYIIPDNTNDISFAGADIFINPLQGDDKSVFLGYDEAQLANYKAGSYYAPFNVLQRRDDPTHLTSKFTSVGETAILQLESIKKNVVLNMGITEYNDLSFFTNTNRARPFFSFKKDVLDYYNVGFGTTSPSGAQVQIYSDINVGSNMFKLTKMTNVDSPDSAPGITLEKMVATTPYAWKFVGPEERYNQKLQIFYEDPSTNAELFTFTNNGCLGIGNTQPEFAVDIATADNKGSIRMYQSDPYNAKPQLLFQSGSNQYGVDTSTDYRMYAYSNNFYVDMQDIRIGQKTLFHFTSNTALGIHQEADSRYNVSINGTLNVKKAIYIDGKEIFSVGDTINQEGVTIRGINVFLIPDTLAGGGVVINHNGSTSNLFYMRSGEDGNMMVLDSDYPEAQINFRNTEEDNSRHLYRLAASNKSFILEYSSNDIYGGTHLDDKHEGYLRVVEWAPAAKNKFDMVLDANLRMDKSADPNIYLRGSTIGHSNSSLYLLPEQGGGVGIGTFAARGAVHILNSNSGLDTTLYVQQSNVSAASYFMRLVNGETEKLVVDAAGNVGIGTGIAISPLTVYGDASLYGHVLPIATSTFNLGSSNMRWKDLYLSGTTLDMDNICIQKTTEGQFKFNHQSNDSLVGIVAKSIQLEHSNVAHLTITKDSLTHLPLFTTPQESYLPVVLNTRLNTIGIGTVASPGIGGYVHIYNQSNIPALSIQTDTTEGAALYIAGSNFINAPYIISGQGIFSVGEGHQPHMGSNALINLNNTSNLHILMTNQTNSNVDHIVMQYNGVTKTVFDAYGNLGIGTGTPMAALHVEGRTELYYSDITRAALCVHGVADFNSNVYAYQNIEITGDTICHGNTIQDSDIRIKSNLLPIHSALDKICQLTGYTYDKMNQQGRQTGLIAQEVQQVLPEAVFEKDDGILGLAYGNLMGLIVEGIKELREEIRRIPNANANAK